MFKEHDLRARLVSAAVAVSLGLTMAAGAQAAVPPPGTINVLHSFAGADGSSPQGNLQLALHFSGNRASTTLFGTAQAGGANGDGNIFAQGTQSAGPFSDVFDFAGANGASPSGGLSGLVSDYTINGPFVGVASAGGKYGYGCIYEATSNGAQVVLYSFTGLRDGANPVGRLVFKDGSFYGTTSAGALGYGTVFRFSPRSGLVTLHHFTGGNDGATPLAGLTLRLSIPSGASKARSAALAGRVIDASRADGRYVDPNLYGTTSNGGAGGTGNGTIFKLSPSGAVTTLFTFTDSDTAPGATPAAELATDFDGNLYGTTLTGGSSGLGEVFVFSPTGTYTPAGTLRVLHNGAAKFAVLHDFALDPTSGLALTGANPLAPVTIAFNGILYGTTSAGSANGLGNVFSIVGTTFALKYEFSGPDGATPEGALLDGLDGNLYGTTNAGGAYGLGTVFAIGE